jgi:hypothetical protein
MGGGQYVPNPSILILNMIDFWWELKDLLDMKEWILTKELAMLSIADVLDSFPKDCEAVITLGPDIFNRLTKNMSDDINCVDDQLVIASMLSRKISCPLECQYMFAKTILEMKREDKCDNFELRTKIVKRLYAIFGPLIIANPEPFNMYESIISYALDSPMNLEYLFVLVGCIIQSGNLVYFKFIREIIRVLERELRMSERPAILAGAMYVIGSVICFDPERCRAFISDELSAMLIDGINSEKRSNFAYRELKLSMIVMCYLARMGNIEAYNVGCTMVEEIARKQDMDETIRGCLRNDRLHDNQKLLSLSSLIEMPVDRIDEIALLNELSGKYCVIEPEEKVYSEGSCLKISANVFTAIYA